jgi:hypothetical protein
MLRRSRRLVTWALLSGSVFLFACDLDPEVVRSASSVNRLTINECGSFVSMPLDGSLRMELEAFPSGGYIWQPTQLDVSHLAVSAEPWEPRVDPDDEEGQLQRFEIHAYRAGRSTLRWELRNRWAAEGPVAAVCELSLVTSTSD